MRAIIKKAHKLIDRIYDNLYLMFGQAKRKRNAPMSRSELRAVALNDLRKAAMYLEVDRLGISAHHTELALEAMKRIGMLPPTFDGTASIED